MSTSTPTPPSSPAFRRAAVVGFAVAFAAVAAAGWWLQPPPERPRMIEPGLPGITPADLGPRRFVTEPGGPTGTRVRLPDPDGPGLLAFPLAAGDDTPVVRFVPAQAARTDRVARVHASGRVTFAVMTPEELAAAGRP